MIRILEQFLRSVKRFSGKDCCKNKRLKQSFASKKSRLAFIMLLFGLVLNLNFPAFAQVTAREFGNADGAAQRCRLIDDNMQRLLCFDALFDTPLERDFTSEKVDGAPLMTTSDAVGAAIERPIGDMILAMERERPSGFDDWQVSIRRWQGGDLIWSGAMDAANLRDADLIRNNSERNPVDIFMTMKEADVPADRAQSDRAVLLLSCDNDITTLGVLLPQPINTLSANLSLSGSGGVLHRLNWRNVESGSLVIAGRGLESIETIKAIADSPRIQFQVTYPEGSRAFVFNMRGLKARLRPFRMACHW